MRVVMRILLVEFSAAWVLVLAGMARAGLQAVPFCAAPFVRAWHRVGWRWGLGVLIGVPVVVGWPLLFSFMQTESGYHAWLKGIAIPWWIVLGCCAIVLACAQAEKAEESA